jgi:hypothetical protein
MAQQAIPEAVIANEAFSLKALSLKYLRKTSVWFVADAYRPLISPLSGY